MTNKKQSKKEEQEGGFRWRTIRARVVPQLKTDVAVQSAILGETEQEFVIKAVEARLKAVKP